MCNKLKSIHLVYLLLLGYNYHATNPEFYYTRSPPLLASGLPRSRVFRISPRFFEFR